jgi:hypothetical protein
MIAASNSHLACDEPEHAIQLLDAYLAPETLDVHAVRRS